MMYIQPKMFMSLQITILNYGNIFERFALPHSDTLLFSIPDVGQLSN